MAELGLISSTPRTERTSVRVAAVAERQWGVLKRAQLVGCGLSSTGIARWIRSGRLLRMYPGVYALGHRALPVEGHLTAALFHAGASAALSHGTAAWWWGLVRAAPAEIHVSVPNRRRLTGLRGHHPRCLERTWHRRLPVTPVARTLLDVAATAPRARLRRMLAEADYQRLVTLDEVDSILGRGHPGSASLRAALDRHRPQLARTLSVLEERFLALCEERDIPLPEVNVKVGGFMVDALWREQRLIVELDGHAAHATPAAVERDRRRELALRAAGYRILRYTWQQITEQPQTVSADLRRGLSSRESAHERRPVWHD